MAGNISIKKNGEDNLLGKNLKSLEDYKLMSIDVFRGLNILLLLVVSNLVFSDIPEQFTNAQWNEGVHLADMIFPWFLFAAGVTIGNSGPFDYQEKSLIKMYVLKSLKTTLVMFCLGMLVDSTLAGKPVFGFGILQLIGIGSFITTLLYSLSKKKRILIFSFLLLGYWALIRFLPVPGIGSGAFTQEINAIAHLNKAFFKSFNLEGVILIIPASSMVLLGSCVGDFLRENKSSKKALLISLLGLFMAGGGWLWNLDLPFNKPLLTPSYILYAGGWGCVILGILYGIIDIEKKTLWSEGILVFGVNAIIAYVAPIVLKTYILKNPVIISSISKVSSPLTIQSAVTELFFDKIGLYGGGILYTIIFIMFWWVILYLMKKRNIYLTP